MRRIASRLEPRRALSELARRTRDPARRLIDSFGRQVDPISAWRAVVGAFGVSGFECRTSYAPPIETLAEHWVGLACFLLMADDCLVLGADPAIDRASLVTRRGLGLMAEQAAEATESASDWRRLAETIRASRVGDMVAVGAEGPSSFVRWLSTWHELVLASCWARQRKSLGAYYTPFPLAGYVARCADALARRALGESRSGAGRRVRWLDPACGSGVFLDQCWPHVAGRPGDCDASLTGWDLALDSCCVARVLTELTQADVEVRRADALRQEQLGPDEVDACVIVGNPPYGNFGRDKTAPRMRELLRRYKNPGQQRKCNLDDTAIQFLRWAEHYLENSPIAVLAFVVNNTFLDGVTHGLMRQSLMNSFQQIYVLDLHGSSIKRETQLPGADGVRDENVFGIRQGVCAWMAARGTGISRHATGVWRCDVFGSRREKMKLLQRSNLDNTPWRLVRREISPAVFRRRSQPAPEYASFPRLDQIFEHYVSGVQSKCDALFLDEDRQTLRDRIRGWLSNGQTMPQPPAWLRRRLEGCQGREPIDFDDQLLRPIYVAPWDRRWIYYDPRLLGRARHSVMRHLLAGDNVALAFMRQSANPGSYDHFLAVDAPITDRAFYSGHGTPYLAPLWLEADSPTTRRANFRDDYVREFGERASRLGIESPIDPRSMLGYLYGVFWSPAYRARHADALRHDFPRAPWPASIADWKLHARHGRRLLRLHVCGPSPASARPGAWSHRPSPRVNRPKWDAVRQCILVNAEAAIGPLDDAAWRFHCGGYAVLRRWLKQRQGLTLHPPRQQALRRLLQIIQVTSSIQRRLPQ